MPCSALKVPPKATAHPSIASVGRGHSAWNDVALEDSVRRQSDRVAKAFFFEEVIEAGQRKRRVAPEEASQPIATIPGDNRL